MKPIVLAELAGSAGCGGGERYLELLLDRLDPARFSPIVICPEPGPFIEKMRAKGIKTHVVHLAPLFNPLALIRLAAVLRREEVAILQTHGARANVYGRLAAWLAGVPCVVATVHNSIRNYQIGFIKRWVYGAMYRLMLPRTDRIICVSDALLRDILEECPNAAQLTTRVWNGIDPVVLTGFGNRDRVRKEWCVGHGPVLLTVARLAEEKGHRFLIDALPGLLAEWPSLVCLFVGDGECRESLRDLAKKKGVESSCRFVGPRNDVIDWYAAADVMVLPSLSEGFPFAVLEALAMSCPVVATVVNGVPEIITEGKTGLLVPPGDARALEAALRNMLRDRARASRMAKAGQKEVFARFTAAKMAQDTVRVFEEAMPKLHGPSRIACRAVRKDAA